MELPPVRRQHCRRCGCRACAAQPSLDWEWGLLLPALVSVGVGTYCAFAAKERPSDVGLPDRCGRAGANLLSRDVEEGHISRFQRALKENVANEHIFAAIHLRAVEQQSSSSSMSSLGMCEVLQIPRVASYMVAFGLFKFVNYCIFFWLPYYLSQSFSASQSSLLSASYDVGMIPGGIMCGLLSDMCRGGARQWSWALPSHCAPSCWRSRRRQWRTRPSRIC